MIKREETKDTSDPCHYLDPLYKYSVREKFGQAQRVYCSFDYFGYDAKANGNMESFKL